MPIVYIGIGSNLGDRKENCEKAVILLSEVGVTVIRKSSLYETEPWGVIEQPMFINMAIEAETDLEPNGLLEKLKVIESKMGREAGERFGPRQIDLDILLYDNLVLKTRDLEIPHPQMHVRRFVLMPLSEIAPEIIHPILGKTIRELAEGA